MKPRKYTAEALTAKFVFDCVENLRQNEFDLALHNVVNVIEYTSKKYYPDKKPKERFEKFIKTHNSFIYFFSTKGRLEVSDGGKVVYHVSGNISGELCDILYRVRNSLIHDNCNLPEIDYVEGYGIGNFKFVENCDGDKFFTISKGFFIISTACIVSLCLTVCLVKKNYFLSQYLKDIVLDIGFKSLKFDEYFGTEKFDEIKQNYFPSDT